METEEDYSFIYSILRRIVAIVLGLLHEGFTHITKKNKEDKRYLDMYIENMKFR